MIFNRSFRYRLVDRMLAAYLTTALVVGAVGAYHLVAARRARSGGGEGSRMMFSMPIWMAAVVAPSQILAGDAHGLNTLKYQPTKIAAMKGEFQTQKDGASLFL